MGHAYSKSETLSNQVPYTRTPGFPTQIAESLLPGPVWVFFLGVSPKVTYD